MEFTQKEINLGLITSKYEEALLKSEDKKAFKVMLASTIKDLDFINQITENSINKFPGTKYSDTVPSKKQSQETVSLEVLENLNLKNVDPNKLLNYIEKCLDCDNRIKFDFQLNPDLNLSESFSNLMSDVNQSLSLIDETFSKERDLSQICALLRLFEGITCPQDILMMIISFKLALKQYASQGLSLKFDWLTLFGPIIQGIAQLLAALTNTMFSIIENPLDCLMSKIYANLDLLKQINPDMFNGSDPNILNISTVSSTKDGFKQNTLTLEQFDEKINQKNSVPTGFDLNFNLIDFINLNGSDSFSKLSLPDKFVLAFQDARNTIARLKNKILELINNINGLVKNGKLLEIKNISIILFITDILSFLGEFINLDFDNLYQLCENNPSKLEDLVKSLYNDVDTSVKRVDNGFEIILSSNDEDRKIYVNSCATVKSESLNYLNNLIDDIESKLNG